ncbi:alpha-amylase family glycosyl hydrolase [Psychromarinibacter sp. S121]|uniref:alpha-amylase family glycosyl hydrolase n=1 Tax=Psychromarinibacter sp. S121 TaxID=3415127 RepID=UPI003C799086
MNLLDPQIPQPDNSASDPDWWRGAVIYQIYPRSYQDSNGDGVGDLAGIIHRLPHIASLGVDAIWISPFMKSPMLDFGYDVSDYRDVDPMFGTLGDFDALIERAHELGLKVLIDLVISHSSEDHPWFKESRASADNARSDWYVWADAKPDGSPPNNWLSIFGGSAWEWDGERMQYYLHNFLTSQPDLNLHNPDVQDELLDITRFWLERGVDGFRLDTINFYFHDKELRDNPALDPSERNDKTAPAVNPYNWQNHLYSKNQPENLEFLKRFRAVLDAYPGSTAVGEVGEAQRGMEIQAAYTSDGDKVHMTYGFDFLANQPLSGDHVAQVLNDYEEGIGDGWACWAFSNHDVVRHPSRWHMDEAGLRLAASLLLTLRGSVCLYQGEELGLTEAYVAFEDLQDPYGIRFWPKFKGRDGCRTPMVWSRDNHNGGFSEAKPWLPVAMEHVNRAVSVQDDDAGSTLAFYRAMIAFRAQHPAFAKGTLTVHSATPETLVMSRSHDGETLVCAFNFAGAEATVDLPDGDWTRAADAPYDTTEQGKTVTLAPHAAYFGVKNG